MNDIEPESLTMEKQSVEFRARAVVESDYIQGAEYCGASSGVISPGQIARAVFSDGLEFGRLFAYCFRRFGHPNTSSDDHKGIASYIVTTPFDGLFLSIEVKPHNDPGLLFGYRMTAELEEKLQKERRQIIDAWHVKFKAWRVLHGISLSSDKPGHNESNYLENHKQFTVAQDKYVSMGGPRLEDFPSNTTIYAVNLAIRAALEDLKTPVGVRDVLFSATESRVELPLTNGDDEDCDGDDPRVAPKHQSAGYYVPSAYFEKPELFCLLHEKLSELGGGSLAKGLVEFTASDKTHEQHRTT